MKYSSLEQRMAQNYIDMFPGFVPDDRAPIGCGEQEYFYDLMKRLYRLAFDEPLLFVAGLHEDDFYPDNNKSAYNKPTLQVNMNKFTKAVNTLVSIMYLTGKGEDAGFNKRQLSVLAVLGINDLSNLPPGWTWMSTRPDSDYLSFSHCFFKKDHPYTSGIFSEKLGKPAFQRLEDWMKNKGYLRYDIAEKMAGGHTSVALVYANPAWSGDIPKSNNWSGVKQTGICVNHRPFTEPNMIFGLCIPGKMMKTFIDSFNTMNDNLKSFFIDKTVKCWDCNYCIQTDKTGNRPKVFTPVQYNNKEFRLCPYYPGFSFSWSAIDDDLADNLIEMLIFMDKYAA